MKGEHNYPKLAPILLIVLAVVARLVPHPPNVAPISAMALFGGVYFPKRYAFLIPFSALILSDTIIGFYGPVMLYVYGSFALISLVGIWLGRHKKAKVIIGASLFSSILFYLITNFGVWIATSMYAKDLNGLAQSYLLAALFFRNTVIGDLAYTGVFFFGYEFTRNISRQFLPEKYFRLAF